MNDASASCTWVGKVVGITDAETSETAAHAPIAGKAQKL